MRERIPEKQSEWQCPEHGQVPASSWGGRGHFRSVTGTISCQSLGSFYISELNVSKYIQLSVFF